LIRNLFMILFRPNTTVDRLLEERKHGQSWGATWFLIGLHLLILFLVGVFFAPGLKEVFELLEDEGGGEGLASSLLIGTFVGLGIVAVIVTILYFVLSRFFFQWLVVLGLRMVASSEYPKDPAERREKGRLLTLIQPYTLWIYMLSTFLPLPFLPLLFDMSVFVEMIELSAMGMDTGDQEAQFAGMFISFLLWCIVAQILSLGLYIYMIIVRVMAIKKIYNISTAKAFFGPFLTYLLLYVILFLLYLVFILLMAMIDPTVVDPYAV
jgi:hypothetical protein